MFKIHPSALIGVAFVLTVLFLLSLIVGINDAGSRTVIQYPTGQVVVRFEPGIYFSWFGKTEAYYDVMTFDFDKSPGRPTVSVGEANGIAVRYQDGGTGTIYGKVRFNLPADEDTMIGLHKAFRSGDGVSYKLLKSVTEESMNMTAGLMSSEEAYAEKRGIFIEWSREQLQSGKYKTELKQVVDTEEGTGNRVIKNVPVIAYGTDGLPQHLGSDLKTYGITVSGYQITDWNFETKTLEQISKKREATMAIITAKAQAEQAKQEAITAEEKGKAEVMKAKYEMEVEKERAVVEAQKAKEVAVIAAQRAVDVAEKAKLEAEQKKLAASEYKQEQMLRGEGDAAYKRQVMQADGALQQKLDAWVRVNARYAEAIEKQKWVPEVALGGASATGNGNAAQNLLDLFMTKTAKDLALDMSVKN